MKLEVQVLQLLAVLLQAVFIASHSMAFFMVQGYKTPNQIAYLAMEPACKVAVRFPHAPLATAKSGQVAAEFLALTPKTKMVTGITPHTKALLVLVKPSTALTCVVEKPNLATTATVQSG